MVHTCTLCDRFFESLRGLNIHQAHCKFKQVIINRTNQDVVTEDVYVNENIVVETSTIVESEEIDIEIEVELKPYFPSYTNSSSVVKVYYQHLSRHEFVETINRVHDEMGSGEKPFQDFLLGMQQMFIRDLTSWLEHFNRDSKYKYIALKVCMILPSLLLQKPNCNRKVKDHTKKLEERLSTWKGGRIMDLVKEGRIIQERIRSSCQQVSKDMQKSSQN